MASLLKPAPFPKLLDKINWFPGHMHWALKLIEKNSHKIDLFIELRDARVPISSKNNEFDTLI